MMYTCAVFACFVQPAINVLMSIIKDSDSSSAAKSSRKKRTNATVLQRPIICICNDLYVPSLRQLRHSAFLVTFYAASSIALSARLLEANSCYVFRCSFVLNRNRFFFGTMTWSVILNIIYLVLSSVTYQRLISAILII